jgi:hypothetical protein
MNTKFNLKRNILKKGISSKISLLLILLLLNKNFILGLNNMSAFYIGHSLSDGVIDMVKSLSDNNSNVNFNFRYQTIPGSPLRWNWQAKGRNDYPVNSPLQRFL